MPKFSHTAEIGTLCTSGDRSAAPGCARHATKTHAALLCVVGSQCGESRGFKPCKGHSYRSGRDDLMKKNSCSSAMKYWLILLGRNVVKVMGSNPAGVIVIEVVVVIKHGTPCTTQISLLFRFFIQVDTCI
jgi:hypothetical protein